MKNCGGCGSWIPDDARACPSCGGAAGPAPVDPPEGIPPAASPPPLPPDPGGDPEAAALASFIRARTERRIRTLGLLHILFGGLQIGMVILFVIRYRSGEYLKAIEELRERFGGMADLDRLFGILTSPAYLLFSKFLPFAVGVLLLWTGVRLRALQGRTAGLVAGAALLGFSVFDSFCCCLGLALGVWTLTLLASGEAKVVMDRAPS